MVNITLATNTERKNVITEAEDTVQAMIEREGVDVTGAQVLLRGMVLGARDLQCSFEELGVQDGTSAILNVAVKAVAA